MDSELGLARGMRVSEQTAQPVVHGKAVWPTALSVTQEVWPWSGFSPSLSLCCSLMRLLRSPPNRVVHPPPVTLLLRCVGRDSDGLERVRAGTQRSRDGGRGFRTDRTAGHRTS